MKDIKMIMLDVDGTLLTDDHRVTDTTKNALLEAKNQGIIIGLASGRAGFFINKVVAEYELTELFDVASGLNGGHFIDFRKNTLTKKEQLPGTVMPEIYEKCKGIDANIITYDEFGVYARRDDETARRSSANVARPLFVTDFLKETDRKWDKILVMRETPFTETELAYLYSLSNDIYHGFHSSERCYEIVSVNISKSKGIAEIAQSYGFSLNEVMAFGDSGNDIDMLEKCGVGVCMGNGTDIAKKAADYVTLSNEEDGIAAFLYRYIIHNNLKCVMLDLDGTLFDEDKNVSEYTKDVLRKVHDRGIKIGVATGRPVSTVEKKIEKWGLEGVITLIVGMNGSNIKNLETGSFTNITSIPKEAIDSIINFFDDMPIEVMISGEEELYMANYTEFAKHVEFHDEIRFVQTDFNRERHMDWPKLCILFEKQYRQDVIDRNKEFKNEEVASAIGSHFSLEFMSINTNKGYGVTKLCEEIGIDLADVMAIGDNSNDVEMLKVVGIPVCMINGAEEAKEVSRYITKYSNDEEGVAKHLRWYI